MLRCTMGSCIVVRVRLVDGVLVGVGAPVAAKISASCQMSSIVWASKQAKGSDNALIARGQVGAWLCLWVCWWRTYMAWHRCGRKLYSFGHALSSCLWYVNLLALVV